MLADSTLLKIQEAEARRDNSSGKGSWYKIIIHECPICGGGKTYRERRYSNKPDTIWDQYERVIAYDYCNAL